MFWQLRGKKVSPTSVTYSHGPPLSFLMGVFLTFLHPVLHAATAPKTDWGTARSGSSTLPSVTAAKKAHTSV